MYKHGIFRAVLYDLAIFSLSDPKQYVIYLQITESIRHRDLRATESHTALYIILIVGIMCIIGIITGKR